MALWQNQLADRADTTKNPQFQNIQNMIYAGSMDPETALGYTLGRFLSSRYDRWMKNKADDEYETLQKDIKNNTLTTPDGNVLDRNLMYGNQFNNPAIQGGTSAGTTAIDSSMANAAGIGASNQLLGNGLGNSTAQGTAQQMADTAQTPAATTTNDVTNGLLTGLEGAKSMVNLGQGKADLGDFLNLSKMLTFFDPAATGENGSAANGENTEQKNAAPNAGEDLSFLGRGVDIRDLAGTEMEGLQTESAPLDQQGREFAAALIQAKQAYDIGKSQNNQQVMQTAAETANRIRNVAGQLGIDLTPYDSGRTLAQAQDAFMVDTNRGIQNIFRNDMTSDEYYEKLFSDLRHNGMSREQAQRIAAREAGQYQAQRLTRLNDALVQYGVDPLNHTINDYGVMILMRAQQEDPNAASGLARMYGLPADLASEVVQMNLANNNARNSLANAMATNDQQYRLGRQQAQDDAQLKAQFAAYKNQLERENIQYRYDLAKQHGYSDQAAFEFATTGKIGSRKKGSTNSGNGRSQSSSTADARAIIEMANKWDEDHPGQEWANPYRQDAANAEQAIHNAYDNTFSSYLDENGEITDAGTAYSAGTWLLENNAKNNYPATQQEMEAVIRKQIPRFADALIQQWRNDGTLAKYSA